MTRARDLGIPFEGNPGPLNAITDVEEVLVGHTTLISGNGRLQPGNGPVRTGVTAVLPRGKKYGPVFAGIHIQNGAGEMTGAAWVEETGLLESGIMLTNTASIGEVHSASTGWALQNIQYGQETPGGMYWFLPVVAETVDYVLNDVRGLHVKPEHVFAAIENAASGPVAEGNVGGGTGMICYEFKGGIGTASRRLHEEQGGYTVGALVQTNYGRRDDLVIAGVPVGKEITDLMPEVYDTFRPYEPGEGSIIGIIATDCPLLPTQLKRLARRVPMGIARLGGLASTDSGDIFIAFSTTPIEKSPRPGVWRSEFLSNEEITPLFAATIQATEEAIVNALVAAETMTGINGNKVYALPHERVREVLRKYKRLESDI